MLHLHEKGVEVLRKRICSKKTEAYWDNYDIVIWNKDENGYLSTKGVFRNNSWGIAKSISVSEQGTWVLPIKYVKYFK